MTKSKKLPGSKAHTTGPPPPLVVLGYAEKQQGQKLAEKGLSPKTSRKTTNSGKSKKKK